MTIGSEATWAAVTGERGVLQLEKKPSWLADPSELPPPGVEPFVRDFANMDGPINSGSVGNYTAFLWAASSPADAPSATSFIVPDTMHIWLFQEIIETGGPIAFALQSMITVLSSMAYYDQILQFDNNQTTQVDYIVIANTRRYCRGRLAVCIALIVHLALIVVVTLLFAKESRLSMLGNTW
ncbi:hypothetical protein N431DRAFT_441660 [Stipitochalara longipes BDJ]|nr:hypothetical protein N431DRAFT_441660 [Stipitochalara longipes BDJ]